MSNTGLADYREDTEITRRLLYDDATRREKRTLFYTAGLSL